MMGLELIHVYFGFLALGLGYAIVVFVLGNLGGDHGGDMVDGDVDFDPGLDLGQGHAVDGVSPFSPMVLATFATLFGGLGLIFSGILRIVPILPVFVADIVSLLLSSVCAVLLASYFSLLMIKIFVRGETSTETSVTRIAGSFGTASEDIAPGKTGEVTYLLGGSRQCGMARLAEGATAIKRGTPVEIVSFKDNVAYVRAKESAEQPASASDAPDDAPSE